MHLGSPRIAPARTFCLRTADQNTKAIKVIPQNPTVSVTVSANVPPMEQVNCPHGPAVSATGRGTNVVLSYDDGTQEVRQGGSHSWRNNNPGNIRPGYLEGEIGKAGGFTIFSSEERGQAAIIENLGRPQFEGKTVYGAIAAWAPPKENNTAAYQARVSSLTGLNGNTLLTDLNQSELESVGSAIRTVEG